jgi:hypothetical protein
MKTYHVTYERDEGGWWLATVAELSGCHTQGRTVEQARERVREAIALFGRQPTDNGIEEVIRLPAEVRSVLGQAQRARRRAEDERKRAQTLTREAVGVLLSRLGVSVRDAARLLGISHQRVQQLAGPRKSRIASKRARPSRRARRARS